MEKGSIFTSKANYLGTITFSHPKGNSFPSELLQKLVDSLDRLSEDPEVKVVLLKSEGERSFCAGASFDELLNIENEAQGLSFFNGFANLINAMRRCKKPIVCRVQGKTVGGGVGIMAAADYCFATEAADLKLSELSIGIGPFVIGPAIERKAGIAALNELALNAKSWKTAYWGQKKGLIQKVYENSRDMDEGIDSLCQQLCSYNPEALEAWKKASWEGTDHWEELLVERARISGALVLSDFTRSALEKFRK